MTQAQIDTLEKMSSMIREHFDSGILIVEGEGQEGKSHIEISYHGGYATAHGLLVVGQHRIFQENESHNPYP